MEGDGKKTAKESIRPDFLSSTNKDSAINNLNAIEAGALMGDASGAGAAGAGFINNVAKNSKKSRGGKKSSGAKKILAVAGASITVVVLLIFALLALIFAVPIVVLATIDYGLQEALGFDITSEILDEQAIYVLVEAAGSGMVPSNFADDLAAQGIEIGQVTLAGDFIRTNNYLGEIGEIASTGDYYNSNKGELAMKFDDEIIAAADFVDAAHTNPRLYLALRYATDMSARFYYSKDVEKVYKDFGLSRNNFANYKSTGNIEEDKKQFEEIFNSIIEKVASVGLNGYDEDCPEDEYDETCLNNLPADGDKESCITRKSRTFTTLNSEEDSGSVLASSIASSVAGENATEKAVSLLNTAVSANEPYIAAGVFLATEEALNRARIDGDGPVDPLLNTLSAATSVKVTDVKTGETTVTNRSVVGTHNFIAAVNNHSYSVEDARNYSRDRIIDMSGGVSADIINDTTMASDDSKKFNILIKIKGEGETNEVVGRAANSLSTTFYDDVFETTKSTIGGNRIVMGGSFLSNSINSRVLGAMPSDAETVAKYKNEVDTILARRAEAERATLSPFDISSKYTFLGSLVRKFGQIAVRNFSHSSSGGMNFISSVADLFSESAKTLVSGTVLADVDESFMMINGNCPTSYTAAEVVGDLYCTSHNTMDTSRMSWGLEQYKEALGDSLDEEGEIVKDRNLSQFVTLGMGRETTVGIEDSDICEAWKEIPGNQGILDRILDALSSVFGLYESCRFVDDGVAIGSNYTLSSSNAYSDNVGLYSSFVLYDTVSSLLEEKDSSVARFKERYYKEYPLDNSEAGIIARRSGMTKKEAEIALSYHNYLKFLANYDPSDRYAFINPSIETDGHIDFILNDKKLYEELAIIGKEIFYRDLRILTISGA